MHDHYWVIKASRGQSIGFERADELHAVQCLVGRHPDRVDQDRGALRLRLGFTTFDASATVPLFKKKSPGAPRALPLDRKLTGIALAERIAAQ